jgi:hypothetical protein
MAKPSEIHNSLQIELARIRGNRAYTPDAKQVLVARAYRKHKQQLDALREQDESNRKQTRAQLSRDLFGIDSLVNLSDPTGSRATLAVSFRDAQDRAARIEKEQEAVDLLARAERSGDRVLAKAIVERAYTELWVAPMNAYAEAHPGTEEKLQQLIDMDRAPLGARLLTQMEYSLSKPPELSSASDRQIDSLAESTIVDQAGAGSAPSTASYY